MAAGNFPFEDLLCNEDDEMEPQVNQIDLSPSKYITPSPKRIDFNSEPTPGSDSGLSGNIIFGKDKMPSHCICGNDNLMKMKRSNLDLGVHDPYWVQEILKSLHEKQDREIVGIVLNLGVEAQVSRWRGLDFIIGVKEACDFSSKTAFLAILYFDKYISLEEDWQVWGACKCRVSLVSGTCISLASKLEESYSKRINFSSKHAKNVKTDMELYVLKTLSWRLQNHVTPFDFLDYMIEHIARKGDNKDHLMLKASEKIMALARKGDYYLTCRPSDIAIAAALSDLEPKDMTEDKVTEYAKSVPLPEEFVVNIQSVCRLIGEIRGRKRKAEESSPSSSDPTKKTKYE